SQRTRSSPQFPQHTLHRPLPWPRTLPAPPPSSPPSTRFVATRKSRPPPQSTRPSPASATSPLASRSASPRPSRSSPPSRLHPELRLLHAATPPPRTPRRGHCSSDLRPTSRCRTSALTARPRSSSSRWASRSRRPQWCPPRIRRTAPRSWQVGLVEG
ncbi:hypothetical protein T484DRAFT_1885225, partial [Baffinella frigidus]